MILRGSRLHLSLNSFILCPLRRISALAKKVYSGILSKPCIILCVSSRSPLFRLSSNGVSLHSFNLCSYGKFLNKMIIGSTILGLLKCGDILIQVWTPCLYAVLEMRSYSCLVDGNYVNVVIYHFKHVFTVPCSTK